jgi:putative flavoprotein involved in K+ transport
MNRVESNTIAAERVFTAWLQDFATAIEQADADIVSSMFDEDGHWKDLLAFTWQHRTFSGRAQIRAALAATLIDAGPTNLRDAKDRTPPKLLR